MLIAGKKLTTSPLCFAAYHMQNQLFTFHFYVPDHDSYQYKTFSIYPHGCLTVKKKKMKERERDGTRSTPDLAVLQFIITVGFLFV